MFFFISAIVARTSSEIARAFEPGAWKMPIATAGLLSSSERSAYSAAPSSMRATSRSRVTSPFGAGLDDDVAELLLALQPALRVDRELQVEARQRRRGADDAGGGLHVLRADLVDDVAGRQAALGDLLRVEPDAHRVVAGAEQLHLADARRCAPAGP